MAHKYSPKDFIYDVAYVAVLIGLVFFIVGSFPEFFVNIFKILVP